MKEFADIVSKCHTSRPPNMSLLVRLDTSVMQHVVMPVLNLFSFAPPFI